jgi:hypothetical protein
MMQIETAQLSIEDLRQYVTRTSRLTLRQATQICIQAIREKNLAKLQFITLELEMPLDSDQQLSQEILPFAIYSGYFEGIRHLYEDTQLRQSSICDRHIFGRLKQAFQAHHEETLHYLFGEVSKTANLYTRAPEILRLFAEFSFPTVLRQFVNRPELQQLDAHLWAAAVNDAAVVDNSDFLEVFTKSANFGTTLLDWYESHIMTAVRSQYFESAQILLDNPNYKRPIQCFEEALVVSALGSKNTEKIAETFNWIIETLHVSINFASYQRTSSIIDTLQRRYLPELYPILFEKCDFSIPYLVHASELLQGFLAYSNADGLQYFLHEAPKHGYPIINATGVTDEIKRFWRSSKLETLVPEKLIQELQFTEKYQEQLWMIPVSKRKYFSEALEYREMVENGLLDVHEVFDLVSKTAVITTTSRIPQL